MTAVQFRAWRTRLGLSITAAAQALGISPSQVCRYQNGSRRVPERVANHCELLDSVDVLKLAGKLRNAG